MVVIGKDSKDFSGWSPKIPGPNRSKTDISDNLGKAPRSDKYGLGRRSRTIRPSLTSCTGSRCRKSHRRSSGRLGHWYTLSSLYILGDRKGQPLKELARSPQKTQEHQRGTKKINDIFQDTKDVASFYIQQPRFKNA